MSIKVMRQKDPEPPFELCCFCWRPTAFWHEKSDVAVCPACATTHRVKDIPSKRAWCDETTYRMQRIARMLYRLRRIAPATTARQSEAGGACELTIDFATVELLVDLLDPTRVMVPL